MRMALVAAAGTALAAAIGVVSLSNRVPESAELDGVFALAPFREEVRELSFGMTFGQILNDAGLGATEQQDILLAFREHHSPRRLRGGTEIRLRWRPDADIPHGISVGLDRDNTLILNRTSGGQWNSSVAVLPTTVDTVYAAGEITTDLWTAVMTDPVLSEMPQNDRVNFVDRLDRVFQWRIDFFRSIRVGDTYRFVFEREKRPDGSMRSGSLLAAELVNAGNPYYAILFDPNGDGQGTWYDLEGESVRRAFLMRPLRFSRISSRYTNSRFHPILRTWRAHRGVDYAADPGTPVEVTADGVIARRGWSDTYGRVIDVRHGNGFLTRYAHLQGFGPGTAVGSRVRQGETIGYVGMTGMATGYHLHYEMHVGGRPVDPLAIELPADDPVPGDAFDRWIIEKNARFALLMKAPGPDRIRSRRADQ
ncbi:MAG: M23 family metallopeptidase [Gemmatimonadetes bacterium]|nr:M23 family metallopeptidase [Gemmatimonadota bacterium]